MRKNKTMRTILLDFVQANGPQSWSDLHRVVLTVAGRNLNDNHWGIGYLDQVSTGSVCFPTRNESRYLVKREDGLYEIASIR
jgi:hypothetical protein